MTEPAPALLALHHDACLEHDTGAGLFEAGPSPLLAVPEVHPESPDLLRNLDLGAGARPAGRRGRLAQAPRASDEELLTIHTPEHIARVDALAAAQGVVNVEGQTFASAATPEAARRSPAPRWRPPTPRRRARRRWRSR